jgi:hypothetical protein
MKQCRVVFLTLVIVVFAAAALTQTESRGSKGQPATPNRGMTRQPSSKSHDPLATAAGRRWLTGQPAHWRAMVLQR